jgi:alpha-tubulin suppressor-like RCC1 family protein
MNFKVRLVLGLSIALASVAGAASTLSCSSDESNGTPEPDGGNRDGTGGTPDVGSPDVVDTDGGTDSGGDASIVVPTQRIGLGYDFSCALSDGGAVRCWGSNGSGQLGFRDAGLDTSSTPVTVMGINDALAISAGSDFACALRPGGVVTCWGSNYYGQIGPGTDAGNAYEPVAVPGINDATMIAVGDYHACALRSSTKKVVCWGRNNDSQLGNGDAGPASNMPVEVDGVSDAVAVAAGGSVGCVIKTDKSALCWGRNDSGQLGRGGTDLTNSAVGMPVANLGPALQLIPGEFHTCAMKEGGTIACWGDNAYGQLGPNGVDAGFYSTSPILIPNSTNTAEVSPGSGDHICALKEDQSILCWGFNNKLQLGSGALDAGLQSPSAFSVGNVTAPAQVAVGAYHTCALRAGGRVACWGNNANGELGNPDAGTMTSTPVDVAGL